MMSGAESIAIGTPASVAPTLDTGLGCLGLVLALSAEAFDPEGRVANTLPMARFAPPMISSASPARRG